MITQPFIFLTAVLIFNWFLFHFILNPYSVTQYQRTHSSHDHNYSIIHNSNYELLCENSRSVLYLNYGRTLVEAIYASNSTTFQYITAKADINNCSAITRHSLTYNNFTHVLSSAKEIELNDEDYFFSVGELVFVSCKNPVQSPLNIDIVVPCSSEAPKSLYSYVLTQYPSVSEIAESCKIDLIVRMVPWGPMTCNEKCSYRKFHSEEVKGIHINWRADQCGVWDGSGKPGCWFENATNMVLCPHDDEAILSGSFWELWVLTGMSRAMFSPLGKIL